MIRTPITRRLREESGQVTAFVVVFAAALLLMAGLVIDGGLALAAKVRAIDEAQAAARAGAQALDLRSYRLSNSVVLDPARAASAARAYLAATGDSGQVRVSGDRVFVTVRIAQPTQILGLVGLHELTVTGSGAATAVRGVTGPGT
jgi:Flp pilus assembly protein TadG